MNPNMLGCFAIVLFCSVAFNGHFASAATGNDFLETSPDDPNVCIRSTDKLTVKVGEEKFLSDCSVATCSKQGAKLTLQVQSCSALIESSENDIKCQKITDSTKPYPGCCPEQKCTDNQYIQVEHTSS